MRVLDLFGTSGTIELRASGDRARRASRRASGAFFGADPLRRSIILSLAIAAVLAMNAPAHAQDDLSAGLERVPAPPPPQQTPRSAESSTTAASPASNADLAATINAAYAAQGRTPDAKEIAFWTARLRSGIDPGLITAVLSGQSASEPSVTRLTAEYRMALDRDPRTPSARGTSQPVAGGSATLRPDGPAAGSTAPPPGNPKPQGAGRGSGQGGPRGGLLGAADGLGKKMHGLLSGAAGAVGKLRASIASEARSAGKEALLLFHRQPEGMQRVETSVAGAIAGVAGPLLDKLHPGPPRLGPTLQLRNVDGQAVLMAGRLPQPCFETQSSRTIIDLAGTWRRRAMSLDRTLTMHPRDGANVRAMEAEMGGAGSAQFDDSGWDTVVLPAVSDQLSGRPDKPCTPGPEGVVYRRTVDIPATATGAKVRFIDLGANYVTDLWVNGRHAGYHEGGFASWALEIGALLHPGTNVLVLRVHTVPWESGFDTIPYARCDWFNYGGPYRPMAIEVAPAFSIDDARLTWDGHRAHVRVIVSNAGKTTARGRLTLALHAANVTAQTIASRDAAALAGEVVANLPGPSPTVQARAGETRVVSLDWDVGAVKTWAPAHPDVYILEVRLDSRPVSALPPPATMDGSPSPPQDATDRLMTQVGFRTPSIDADGPRLMLTGEPLPFLGGVTRHEESVEHGRAVTPGEILRDLRLIKDGLGATFLRTAHYPNDPLTYLIADRLGIAIWEEIPVYWFTLGADFRRARKSGLLLQMWREMVMRDFNRPSILFWSMCNECGGDEERVALMKALRGEVASRYPDGRWVGEADAADIPGSFDPAQDEASVGGWNLYFGIGFEAADDYKKDIAHTYSGTRDFLARAHSDHPRLPLVCTEFGYWANFDDGLAADQNAFFRDAFKAIAENPAVGGCCWWSAFDYYSTITGTDTFGAYTLDRSRARPLASIMHDAYVNLGR